MKTGTSPRLALAFAFAGLLPVHGVATHAAGAIEHRCGHCLAHARAAHRFAHPERFGELDERGVPTRVFPPSRPIDILHTKIELTFEDLDQPRAEALATIDFAPIGKPAGRIELDARGLRIQTVSMGRNTLRFEHDGERLSIRLPQELQPGRRSSVSIRYSIDNPPAGLFFTPRRAGGRLASARVHTQGQPEENSFWFPTHDFPNERMTTEVVVAVPKGFDTLSNGVRISQEQGWFGHGPDAPEFTIDHWKLDTPHPPYLVTLVVGSFDSVELGDEELSMPVYGPPGRSDDLRRTYAATPAMMDFFTNRFGVEYPWPAYAQVVVDEFRWGGMENTGASTMFGDAVFDEHAAIDHDLDGLIAHELAHQWFGNLVTCNSWEHLWLNEGFATLSEGLWLEHRDGRTAYQGFLWNRLQSVIEDDTDQNAPGMASKRYENPEEIFGKSANPYSKGALVLHAIRAKLGDDLFFEAVAEYLRRHAGNPVETDQFRRVLEDVSGESFDRFFWQWVTRAGLPRLRVETSWTDSDAFEGGTLYLSVRQLQHIDGDNPAFAFDLPVYIRNASGESVRTSLRVDTRESEAAFPMRARPAFVAIDPDLALVADTEIVRPGDWNLAQAEHGPTVAARARAARRLTEAGHTPSARLLSNIARDEGEHDAVRIASVRALIERSEIGMIGAIAMGRVEPPSFRAAFAEALAELPDLASDERLGDWLDRAARTDRALTVQAAALITLAKADPARAHPIALYFAETDSHADRLRRAAVETLAKTQGEHTLDTLLALTGPDTHFRTRVAAIEALPLVAEENASAVRVRLQDLVGHRLGAVSHAAIDALVELGDPAALPTLREARRAARSDHDRWRLDGAIRALEINAN